MHINDLSSVLTHSKRSFPTTFFFSLLCQFSLLLAHSNQHINIYMLITAAAVAAKSLQSCPTLYNPIDGSPPGSATPGILQARTLEWTAISFSMITATIPQKPKLKKKPCLLHPPSNCFIFCFFSQQNTSVVHIHL